MASSHGLTQLSFVFAAKCEETMSPQLVSMTVRNAVLIVIAEFQHCGVTKTP